MGRALVAALAGVLALFAGAAARAQEEVPTPTPPRQEWSFNGVFGSYDQAALQRGFQVYKEVCSACHALKYIAYRDLAELGYSDDQIKGFAAQFQVTDGPNDQGQMYQRAAKPSDMFVSPFPNDQAARAANNGALPPDMSMLVKAREGGPDYIQALLTGYVPFDKLTPEQIKAASVTKDDNYNTYFPGHRIAMPPPLADDKVQYVDGTKATLGQEVSDVIEFLAWASEPHLEDRNRTGVRVILFLLAMAGLMYAVKRQVWADKH